MFHFHFIEYRQLISYQICSWLIFCWYWCHHYSWEFIDQMIGWYSSDASIIETDILASPDQRINRKRSIQLRGIIYLYNIFVHTQTQTLFIKESSTQGPPVCWLHRLNESTSGHCTENSFFQAAVSEVERKPLNSSHTAVFDIYMKKIKNKQSNTDLWKEESARKYLHQRSCNKYNF